MGQLHFKNAAAAEMLLHTGQGARMALKLVSSSDNVVMVSWVVTLDGKEVMLAGENIALRPGDTIEAPQSLNVRFSTA